MIQKGEAHHCKASIELFFRELIEAVWCVEFFLNLSRRRRRQFWRVVLAFARAREILYDLRGISGFIPC
jgi:hypothetical protein